MSKIDELQGDIETAKQNHKKVLAELDVCKDKIYEYETKLRGLPQAGRALALEVVKGTASMDKLNELAQQFSTAIFIRDSFCHAEGVIKNEVDTAAAGVRQAQAALDKHQQHLETYEALKAEYKELSSRVAFFQNKPGQELIVSQKTLAVVRTELERIAAQLGQTKDLKNFLMEKEKGVK